LRQIKSLPITLWLGLAALLVTILCLSAVVFANIAADSVLTILIAILGVSTAGLTVLYFDMRKD
jgi:hypothetical protein